ncbi:MAG: hypothetical protein ACRC67_44080 [Inquilinus sp.]|uniref:hypothetical protein n=1 Tax=Inquilinus sp. TaxID=1932117 RepID=UPI003F3DEBAA
MQDGVMSAIELSLTQPLGDRTFPTWHFAMLNDAMRNGIMEAAIKSAGIAGRTVFEIGTGAGLTAIMLARCGADRVITCEMNSQLFEIATEIVRSSPYEQQITIINKPSCDAINDGDIPFGPDFIFTETIDCGVVDEGFYNISHDIQRISSAETQVLPQNIQQFGFLVDSEQISGLNAVGLVNGIDVSPLNRYSTRYYFPVRAPLYQYKTLSATTHLRQYIYRHTMPVQSHSNFYVHSEGWCHGMLSYFCAHFGHHVISNDVAAASHWHQAFHPLRHPVKLIAGETYRAAFSPFGHLMLDHAPS